MFFSKGDKAPTVEHLWLELEGTVKMCLVIGSSSHQSSVISARKKPGSGL
jgi:hypothetical protein